MGATILVLPISLGCRLLTRKVKGPSARAVDLGILLIATGLFWAASLASTGVDPSIALPFGFWFRLTWSSWATLFLPFGVCVGVFEWLAAVSKKETKQPPEPKATG